MRYLTDFSLFKSNRNFTFLFIGQFVSLLGTTMSGVVLPYQIYMLTHSTWKVGLLSLFQLLPLLLTALIGGVFADRYHRWKLLVISESLLTVGGILLAWNAHFSNPSVGIIFIVATFMAGVTGLHRPALESIVQQIVSKKDMPTVSALGMFKSSVCLIAGPAIGGLCIAIFGIVTTYFIDVASFLISLMALLLMRHIQKPMRIKDDSTLTSMVEGMRYALSRQELIGTYFVDFIAMIFGMPTALFPAIAQSFGGAKAVGLLYSAPAIGALFISCFGHFATRIKRHGVAIAISAMLWGVSIICFGLTKYLPLAIFFLALAGAFDAVSGIFRGIIWNQTIPNYLRGRLAGIEMISYLSGPRLGDAEAGLVAAAFGITASVVSGGVLCVIGVGVSCYFLPKFWRYVAKNDD